MPAEPSESLLVFSDVHLGSDIHDRAENRTRRSPSVDRDLVALIDHYRREAPPADRWRMVIAGDFIDFIGMSVAPDANDSTRLATALTDEERAHGIGSAADHARLKLARVAERHADIFRALAAFVAAGHALTVVHGNHDIELHWEEVQADFRALLAAHVDDGARASFDERIEFNPWFFYRDGVAYIEHGHQYDPFCATEHIMTPLSPLDRRRVARGFCETLIRYVVRTTRGMKEHGHETVGLGHYLAFGARLGVSGMVRLGLNFAAAVREMFRLHRAQFSETAEALREEHEERVAKLAARTRLEVERLRALLSLQTPPITRTVSGIMRSVLLDRLALAFGALLALGICALVGIHAVSIAAGATIVAAWIALHVVFSRRRIVDPAAHMIDRAAHVAKLFPAAFVVMGHTHVPAAVSAGDATYINLGSWAEEADDAAPLDPAARATRTHLVIHVRDDGPEAHLRSWGEPDGHSVPAFRPTSSRTVRHT